jgi:hypothetical protein
LIDLEMKRHLTAIAAYLIFFIALLLGFAHLLMVLFLHETNKHGAEIDNAFMSVADYANETVGRTGRFPADADWIVFRASAAAQKNRRISGIRFHPNDNSLQFLALAKHFESTPKSDSYVLALWRGEWNEYYASWESKSTVPSPLKMYLHFGSMALIFIFVGIRGLNWADTLRRRAALP